MRSKSDYEKEREKRTVVFPARSIRILVRTPQFDKPGLHAYAELDVQGTTTASGTCYEKACRSKRCCGRPK